MRHKHWYLLSIRCAKTAAASYDHERASRMISVRIVLAIPLRFLALFMHSLTVPLVCLYMLACTGAELASAVLLLVLPTSSLRSTV